MRWVVGTLRRNREEYSFRYNGSDLQLAREAGFRGYPGMDDFAADYNGRALSAFSSRLPSRDRTDFERLVRGWGAEPGMNDFELLGFTFGRLPTDMYEFIPEIAATRGASFYTDLAGVSNYATPDVLVTAGEKQGLNVQLDPANEFDCHAVEVRNGGTRVGYVKRVHCESVCAALRLGLQVSCTLIRLRFNGEIKEAVVEISYG